MKKNKKKTVEIDFIRVRAGIRLVTLLAPLNYYILNLAWNE